MPRVKEFDEALVLKSAMVCFWQHGYTATSLKMLESATTLTPGSIYNSFGSKRNLFLKSLDHYIDHVIQRRIDSYLCDSNGWQGIEKFITSGVGGANHLADSGCFLINTLTELGENDRAVATVLNRGSKRLIQGLTSAVLAAQSLGHIRTDLPADQLATHISFAMKGILVSNKSCQKSNQLQLSISLLKTSLKIQSN